MVHVTFIHCFNKLFVLTFKTKKMSMKKRKIEQDEEVDKKQKVCSVMYTNDSLLPQKWSFRGKEQTDDGAPVVGTMLVYSNDVYSGCRNIHSYYVCVGLGKKNKQGVVKRAYFCPITSVDMEKKTVTYDDTKMEHVNLSSSGIWRFPGQSCIGSCSFQSCDKYKTFSDGQGYE